MKKIVLIIPYFGKLPEYIDIWLDSVKYNPTIDFLIPTDAEWKTALPENVKLLSMTWSQAVEKIKSLCGHAIVLHEPYKLCDYRPLYGEIFKEYIAKYDFWGHCDMDLVFGDIRKFLTEDILEQNDRIFTRGHFCLYKNCDEINTIYKKTVMCKGINYADAFHTKYSCHFDEGSSMKEVFERNGRKICDEVYFADILYKNYNFELAQDIKGKNAPQIYAWMKGKLMRYYLENSVIKSDEFMYIHLQKRRMKVQIDDLDKGCLIVPNKFCEMQEITVPYIEEHSKTSLRYQWNYYKMRVKSVWKNIRNGALVFRINGKAKV